MSPLNIGSTLTCRASVMGTGASVVKESPSRGMAPMHSQWSGSGAMLPPYHGVLLWLPLLLLMVLLFLL